jgi:hypothetical protein
LDIISYETFFKEQLGLFTEEYPTITIHPAFDTSDFWLGMILLHEGHHACNIDKIRRMPKNSPEWATAIEREAQDLEWFVFKAVLGEKYVPLMDMFIDSLKRFLHESSTDVTTHINIDPDSQKNIMTAAHQFLQSDMFHLDFHPLVQRMASTKLMQYTRYELIEREFATNERLGQRSKYIQSLYGDREQFKIS